MELIAVEGLTIDHETGSSCSGGTFTVTSAASTKVKVNGNGVYSQSVSFSFTGGTYTGGVSETAAGTGVIIATASKVKADGYYVMRLNDEGDIVGTHIVGNTSTAFTSKVLITDANQDKVKAN
jgi:hypothetical protein